MRAIETPYALMALQAMAEYLPARLLRMDKEEPKELLKLIEHKVEMATDWKQTAMAKGGTDDGTTEVMYDLLNPSYMPEEPEEIDISDEQVQQIQQRLIRLAKKETAKSH